MKKHVVLWAVLLALGSCGAPVASCTDGAKNGTEADIDCGGACRACEVGRACDATADCQSGTCEDRICSLPITPGACTDGKKNGAETDVDCGGGTCPACGYGKSCGTATDCGSRVCLGRCIAIPTISSIAPDRGPTTGGTLVTIRGEGFVQGAGFSVTLGGVTALAQVFSERRIDLVVPASPGRAGKVDVVVKNPDGRQALSMGGFLYDRQLAFDQREFPTPTDSAMALIAADLNGDGKLDLATSHNTMPGRMGVLLGKGDGTFNPATSYPIAQRWSSFLCVGDYNGDGKLDITVPNIGVAYENTISIFRNAGNGTFLAPLSYKTFYDPGACASGDLNGDGKSDIVVANFQGANVSVVISNGDGTFQAPVHLPTIGTAGMYVVLEDLNGDGKLDLAVANNQGAQGVVHLRMGNGDGTFRASSVLLAGVGAWLLRAGDLNRDGKRDLVVGNPQGGTVSVLLGRGDGTFSSSVSYPCGTNPIGLAVADLDLDGILDVTVANDMANSVHVLLGKGDGALQAARKITVTGAFDVMSGDFNGDGKMDLATGNRQASVTLLLNTTL